MLQTFAPTTMGDFNSLAAATSAVNEWRTHAGQSLLSNDIPANEAFTACLATLTEVTSALPSLQHDLASALNELEALDDSKENKARRKGLERDSDEMKSKVDFYNSLAMPLYALQSLAQTKNATLTGPVAAGQTGANLSAVRRAVTSITSALASEGETKEEDTGKLKALYETVVELTSPTSECPLTQKQVDNALAPLARALNEILANIFSGSIDNLKVARTISGFGASLTLLLIMKPSTVSTGGRSSSRKNGLIVDEYGQIRDGDPINSQVHAQISRNDISPQYTGADLLEAMRLFALIFTDIHPALYTTVMEFLTQLDILTQHLGKIGVNQLCTKDHVEALRCLFRLLDAIIQHFAVEFANSPSTFNLRPLNPFQNLTSNGNVLNQAGLSNAILTNTIDFVTALRSLRTTTRNNNGGGGGNGGNGGNGGKGGKGGTGHQGGGGSGGGPKPSYTDAKDPNTGASLGHKCCFKFSKGTCVSPVTQKVINGTSYDGCTHGQYFRVHQ